MKKEHSVFICLSSDEISELLQPVFKRKGWLKDIPKDADIKELDEVDFNVEYHWEEDIG
jgi:hypothetical protein